MSELPCIAMFGAWRHNLVESGILDIPYLNPRSSAGTLPSRRSSGTYSSTSFYLPSHDLLIRILTQGSIFISTERPETTSQMFGCDVSGVTKWLWTYLTVQFLKLQIIYPFFLVHIYSRFKHSLARNLGKGDSSPPP